MQILVPLIKFTNAREKSFRLADLVLLPQQEQGDTFAAHFQIHQGPVRCHPKQPQKLGQGQAAALCRLAKRTLDAA